MNKLFIIMLFVLGTIACEQTTSLEKIQGEQAQDGPNCDGSQICNSMCPEYDYELCFNGPPPDPNDPDCCIPFYCSVGCDGGYF